MHVCTMQTCTSLQPHVNTCFFWTLESEPVWQLAATSGPVQKSGPVKTGCGPVSEVAMYCCDTRQLFNSG